MFKRRPKHNIYINGDCLEYMKMMPDNYIDVAICDPAYGINVTSMNMRSRKTVTPDKSKKWDQSTPSVELFNEIFRISKNQIIWGGNYFNVPPSRCWLIWDKGETMYGRDFAECEMAWTSFDKVVRKIKLSPIQFDRIHSTQKPKALYRWIAKNYLKEGDLILDPFVGSANSLAVYEELGFQYVGFEKDADYYNDSLKNIKDHMAYFKTRPKEMLTDGTQLSIYDDKL